MAFAISNESICKRWNLQPEDPARMTQLKYLPIAWEPYLAQNMNFKKATIKSLYELCMKLPSVSFLIASFWLQVSASGSDLARLNGLNRLRAHQLIAISKLARKSSSLFLVIIIERNSARYLLMITNLVINWWFLRLLWELWLRNAARIHRANPSRSRCVMRWL